MAAFFQYETIAPHQLTRETSYTDEVASNSVAEALAITGRPTQKQAAGNPLPSRRKRNKGLPGADELVGLFLYGQPLSTEPARLVRGLDAAAEVGNGRAKWCHGNSAIRMTERLEFDLRGQSCTISARVVEACGQGDKAAEHYKTMVSAWKGNVSYVDGTSRRRKAA